MLFHILPQVCGMVEGECLSVDDFTQPWRIYEKEGEGKRISLYCNNSDLCDMVMCVRGGEEMRGDDTQSIAHKVSCC